MSTKPTIPSMDYFKQSSYLENGVQNKSAEGARTLLAISTDSVLDKLSIFSIVVPETVKRSGLNN